MKLTREVLQRRLLNAELTIVTVALVWLALTAKVFLFWAITGLLMILLATVIWIDKLIRHGVDNFDVCMALGAFIFAADFWLYGYRIPALLAGLIGLGGASWLIKKIARPVSSEQQQANLENYRSRWRADKFSRSLGGELVWLAILAGILFYPSMKSGFSISKSWPAAAIFVWWVARILILRLFPSGADDIQPAAQGESR
jgi:hypothetical protein